MPLLRTAALALALIVANPAQAQDQAPAPVQAVVGPGTARVEIPIHAVRFRNGYERFSINIKIGGQPVEAMLDTGSSGLRVMPGVGVEPYVHPTGRHSQTAYGSGVRLVGEAADATVEIGGMSVDTTIELTGRAECVPEKPACPASRTGPDKYRIGGNADQGEGFLAILGSGLRRSDTPNPLRRLGTGRWIVILPRAGETEGRLILNPSDADVEGFVLYALERQPQPDTSGAPTWWDNRLKGCVVRDEDQASLCAPTMLDSGAMGFHFTANAEPKPNWPRGARGAIAFPSADSADAKPMRTPFTTGELGTAVRFTRPLTEHQPEGLNAGFYPFFAYAVLYDAKAGKIGLKLR